MPGLVPPPDPVRLVLLPYLQAWRGSSLRIRLLLIPHGNPLEALNPALPSSPSFALANLKLDVFIQPNLDAIPLQLPGALPFISSFSVPPVATATTVFEALATQFEIDDNPALLVLRPTGSSVFKHLPISYQQAANFAPGQSNLVFTDSTYTCYLKSGSAADLQPLPPVSNKVTWGKVVAIVLRNPIIAAACGLIREIEIPITPGTLLANGGFVYLNLSPSSDGSGLLSEPNALQIYGSRIPPLSVPRGLFSPVLFPILKTPSSATYDDVFQEVEDYDDGWAKTVHCSQSQQLSPFNETPDGTRPRSELGVRLGWDDEQVTIWMNRQLDESQAPLAVALGVFGYRIDTRLSGSTEWNSLTAASGDFGVGSVDLGTFSGELSVETHPSQLEARTSGSFWLPIYFTAWSGRSLVNKDDVAIQLLGGPDTSRTLGVKGIVPDIDLLYRKSYDFRVRLMDHTGGGPSLTGAPIVPGLNPISTIRFRRWVQPHALTVNTTLPIDPDISNPPSSISLSRGILEYPAVVCTGHYPNAIDQLIADLPAARAENRHPGLSDPDVTQIMITIEVEGLVPDPGCKDGAFFPVATTFRDFPSDPSQPCVLAISWTDEHDIANLVQSTAGSIVLPTARTVRLVFSPSCEFDANYFGASDVCTGPSCYVTVRSNSSDERGLFADTPPSDTIKALFMQPEAPLTLTAQAAQTLAGTPGQRLGDNATLAAAELGLLNDGLTMRSVPGGRLIFGCSASIGHTIGPDLASIRFTTPADLSLHWIIAIQLNIKRDWSRDGLQPNGISVSRNGSLVGQFAPNRNISTDALTPPDRSQTRLIFFDAIDPKPLAGAFPEKLTVEYSVSCTFLGTVQADDPHSVTIVLPVTSPPSQTPTIVSAGIAMSDYQHDSGYTSTTARSRVLWIELDEAPADPNDTYFSRILSYSPDPLLSNTGNSLPSVADPPLAISPEPLRVVIPGQSDDHAGLSAMQQLQPSADPSERFWQLPLPPGLTPDSPELFGFFTYELRVGHVATWSTAQGRFGRPYSVRGVQHPAPALTCDVLRTHNGIKVSLPYALPVSNGISVQAFTSSLWVLLYAQATQLDGAAARNILLARQIVDRPGDLEVEDKTPRYGTTTFSPKTIQNALAALGFVSGAPLSVLGVELLPQAFGVESPVDPLGTELGAQRVLRTSVLTPVGHIC